jgi:hypothetical protein
MSDTSSRRHLATFLRSHRERLTPVDVGIAAGPRRRTPGLRREEVAQLSGVSVTWYTWLEQARDIAVSTQVLDSIGRALLLSSAERRHLFRLAGQQPPPGACSQQASGPLRRMVDALDPQPAYLLNACWDMLACNEAEVGLIGDPAGNAERERNTMWLTFTDDSFRELMVDWHCQALGMLTQYRADAAQHPDDPRFEMLTAGLREASSEFRQWWDHDVIADSQPSRRQFDHPDVGRLTLDYVKLAALESPEVKLITMLPADDATAEKLPRLRTLGRQHSR